MLCCSGFRSWCCSCCVALVSGAGAAHVVLLWFQELVLLMLCCSGFRSWCCSCCVALVSGAGAAHVVLLWFQDVSSERLTSCFHLLNSSINICRNMRWPVWAVTLCALCSHTHTQTHTHRHTHTSQVCYTVYIGPVIRYLGYMNLVLSRLLHVSVLSDK